MTSEVDSVITAVRGSMAVVPCNVTWSSRPPVKLQFHRDLRLLPTLSASRHLCDYLSFLSTLSFPCIQSSSWGDSVAMRSYVRLSVRLVWVQNSRMDALRRYV